MTRRQSLLPVAGLYLLYFIMLLLQQRLLSTLLSTAIIALACWLVYKGFLLKTQDRLLKISGIFFTLCIGTWVIFNIILWFQYLMNPGAPVSAQLISYACFFSGLFLAISLLYSAYFKFNSWNRMQILLDTIVVLLSVMVIIWVFFLKRDVNKTLLFLNQPSVIISIVINILIFSWTIIWFLSEREDQAPLYIYLSAGGGITFAIMNLLSYYLNFLKIDSFFEFMNMGYVIAFSFMGASGFLGYSEYGQTQWNELRKITRRKFRKEILILLVPASLIIHTGIQALPVIFIVTVIMFYFVFTNYTQNNILRDELLKKETSYIHELEDRVEEKTHEIITIMNTDVITGLKNRRYFEEYSDELIKTVKRTEKIVLLYIDQNKYKSMKSMYGKYIAEQTLKKVGNRIEDIVAGEGGLAAAYGEDVFVAVFKIAGFYEQGKTIADKIIQYCSDTYHVESHAISVTLNIGISCFPIDAKNTEELVRNADYAMNQARKGGYNRIQKYDYQSAVNLHHKDKIEMRLKKVNFEDEFSMQYQPQVLCKDGSIFGVEALLRWRTKSGKNISPADFIPITEETGMVIPLGYWVIEYAARQLAKWQNLGANIRVAVNVSSKQLMEEEFTEKLQMTLEEYHIFPELFEIEITENIQLENNSFIVDTLNQISNMGVSIAIDDFGTGYSSLYYLKNLPVNRIKIAKELIDNIENDIYSNSIVQMVIAVAKRNNIKVIAEGVETIQQWECLKMLGCDEIQGYLFSKPVSADDIEQNWLIEYENWNQILFASERL